VVAKAADFYLRKKYGMPVDTIQTLREHLLGGRNAAWSVEDPAKKRARLATGDGQPGDSTTTPPPDR
jgi:hypothetical protein